MAVLSRIKSPARHRWAYESLKVPRDLGDATDQLPADQSQPDLRPRLRQRASKGLLWALTRAIGSSCFGFHPDASQPIESCNPGMPTMAAASADAAEGEQLEQMEAPPAKDGAGAAPPADGGDAGEEDGGGVKAMTDSEVNDALVKALLGLVDGGGEAVAGWSGCHWETVCVTDGVTVYRARLPPTLCIAGRILGGAAKFDCIKAVGVLDAPPAEVFELFIDNARAGEYNEFCRELRDVEFIDNATKVTWSASGRVGPFKERDFVTRVHYRSLPDGTLLVVNRAEEAPLTAASSDRYLRMEVYLGGSVLRPLPGNPNRTIYTTLAHVNPGGVAETRIGAMLMNAAAASGPVKLVQRLRECLRISRQAQRPDDDDEAESDSEEAEFRRLLRQQVLLEHEAGRRAHQRTCPARIS